MRIDASKSAPVHDVLIVGAGPAGTTAATFLARQGLDVRVLERDEFPRFHIGESLLPSGCAVLERLGVTPDPTTFIFKGGAEFVCEATERSVTFGFSEAMDGPPRASYQVERASFDTLLRDAARQAGATVNHGVTVLDVDLGEEHVTVHATTDAEGTTKNLTVRARYLVDATGQGRLLATKFRAVRPFRNLGRSASFVHFDGLSDEAVEEIGPNHNIRIITREDGWAWAIPLPGRRLSVGLTSRNAGARAEDVLDFISGSPLLQRWTAGADASEPTIVGNFSYQNEASYGPRYACIGDAACFIDPVFSSGVSLAMQAGEMLSQVLGDALREGREAAPDAMAPLKNKLAVGYDVFGSLVDRFYNTSILQNVFFAAPKDGDLRAAVSAVLAGDIFREGNAFRDMLLRPSRRGSWRGADSNRGA